MQYFDRHNNPTPPETPVDQALELQARSYRTEVLKATWRGRSRGFWAGIALGAAFGGAVGTVAALATAALPAVALATAVALVPMSAAVFATVGMGLGAAVCTSVGASASAVAGGLKEQDRRMFERQMDAGTAAVQNYNPELDDPHPEKGFIKQFTQGSNKLFKWKVAAVGLLAGAIAGGILASTGGLGFVGTMAFNAIEAKMLAVGIAEAAIPAVTTLMTVVGASMFGSVFGLDMPTLATNTMNFMGKLLSGEIFEGKEEAKARAVSKEVIAPLVQKEAEEKNKSKATTVTPQEMQVVFERTDKERYPAHYARKEAERKAAIEAAPLAQR